MSKTSKMVFAAFMQHCIQSYSCWRSNNMNNWIIDQRLKIHTNMFLLITSLIFNGFSIRKTFESWDLGLFNHTINSYVCWRMLKMLKIIWPSTSSTCFDIHIIWWYGWKALSLSFPKLFADWKLVKY